MSEQTESGQPKRGRGRPLKNGANRAMRGAERQREYACRQRAGVESLVWVLVRALNGLPDRAERVRDAFGSLNEEHRMLVTASIRRFEHSADRDALQALLPSDDVTTELTSDIRARNYSAHDPDGDIQRDMAEAKAAWEAATGAGRFEEAAQLAERIEALARIVHGR